MKRATTLSERPAIRDWSIVKVYRPSVAATLPTPSSTIPTFAPASGNPACVRTRPVNVTDCAESALVATRLAARAVAKRNTRPRHGVCMTYLASGGGGTRGLDRQREQKNHDALLFV